MVRVVSVVQNFSFLNLIIMQPCLNEKYSCLCSDDNITFLVKCD